MATLDSLLHYKVINRIVSRLRGATYKMCRTYGCLPGGVNVDRVGGEIFAWDIFDNTRRVLPGRARGTGPATKKPQAIGHVDATAARFFEQISLDYDKIFRNRTLGGPMGSVDTMGQRYLARQIQYQAQKAANTREAMLAYMFKGGYELNIVGDDVEILPMGSGGQITVNFQHPASNQGNVGGIFAGDWDNVAAPIIDNLLALNRHAMQNSRYPQQIAWITGTTAGHILKNTQVKDLGGTANIVWADRDPLDFTGDQTIPENKLSNIMSFVLRGYPSIRWYVYDDLIERGGTSTLTYDEFIPDGKVLFTPTPDAEWLEYKEGSEPIQRTIGGPVEEGIGLNMWTKITADPVQISLYCVDNGLPSPYVPAAWYYVDAYTP